MVNKYIQKLGNICREKSRKKIICTNVLNIVFGFFIAGKSRIAFVLEYLSALCYIFSLCLFFARFRSNFVSVYNFCNKYPLISKQFQPIPVKYVKVHGIFSEIQNTLFVYPFISIPMQSSNKIDTINRVYLYVSNAIKLFAIQRFLSIAHTCYDEMISLILYPLINKLKDN